MLFKEFCNLLDQISKTSARNEKVQKLSELYSSLNAVEMKIGTYFLQGLVGPEYKDFNFNLNEKTVKKVLENLGYDLSLEKEFEDISTFAEAKTKSEGDSSEILTIYNNLLQIVSIVGKDSKSLKEANLQNIFRKLSGIELKYFIRIILSSMRTGVNDSTIIDALSYFLSVDKKNTKDLDKMYGYIPDLGEIAYLLHDRDLSIFANLSPKLFTPVLPKLVERASGIGEILGRYDKVLIQPKFDGLRLQIHAKKLDEENYKFALFTRNLNDVTDSFDDIFVDLKLLLIRNNVNEIILDSEIIGVNIGTEKFLQFGDTMKKKRKQKNETSQNINVQSHVFDILYLDGKNLCDEVLDKRMDLLNKLFDRNYGMIKLTESQVVSNQELFQNIFNGYVVDKGLEGIIAKNLESMYLPGSRNFDWIKLKRSSDSKLNDTIDGVILGYYIGRGARAKFGIGGLLVGTYDKKSQKYLTICKVGTGFKEEDLRFYHDILTKIRIEKHDLIEVNKSLTPDVFVEPKYVVEIEADEITVSENHSSKYSLRFPRIKKLRYDKKPDQTTTVEEIKEMFDNRFGK